MTIPPACIPRASPARPAVRFANREAVETVFFIGFQDKEELDWRANVLDKLGEVEVRAGKIVPKGQG